MILLKILFRLRLFRYVLLAFALLVVAMALLRCYHWLIGRRNREAGIECIECRRRAFPLPGTVNRYRCAICHTHFTGPGHLN
jgi:hypothetical protein